MAIRIDVHGAFLDVHVTGVLAMEDVSVLIDAMDRAGKVGRFALLTDTLGMDSAPRPVLSAFSDRLKQLPSLKGIWLADAVVINSPIVRFVVSTLIMAAPLPTNVKVFESRNEALAWCASILEGARVPVPEILRRR